MLAPRSGSPGGRNGRDVLLSAIKDITLAKAELNFTYDRTDLVSHEKVKDAPMAKPEPPPKPESIPFE